MGTRPNIKTMSVSNTTNSTTTTLPCIFVFLLVSTLTWI